MPSLVGHIPSGPQWAHEIKWDGYRASLYIADGKVAIRAEERSLALSRRTSAAWNDFVNQ